MQSPFDRTACLNHSLVPLRIMTTKNTRGNIHQVRCSWFYPSFLWVSDVAIVPCTFIVGALVDLHHWSVETGKYPLYLVSSLCHCQKNASCSCSHISLMMAMKECVQLLSTLQEETGYSNQPLSCLSCFVSLLGVTSRHGELKQFFSKAMKPLSATLTEEKNDVSLEAS